MITSSSSGRFTQVLCVYDYHLAMHNVSDILFFDGRCPMCRGEIKLLRRWAGAGLQLVDVHGDEIESLASNFERNDLLQVLHLKTVDETWLKGLDATVRAWGHTPIGWLFTPLRWPLIHIAADAIYHRWAARRACRIDYITQ